MNVLFLTINADLINLQNDLNIFIKSLQLRMKNKNIGTKFVMELEKAELGNTEKKYFK